MSLFIRLSVIAFLIIMFHVNSSPNFESSNSFQIPQILPKQHRVHLEHRGQQRLSRGTNICRKIQCRIQCQLCKRLHTGMVIYLSEVIWWESSRLFNRSLTTKPTFQWKKIDGRNLARFVAEVLRKNLSIHLQIAWGWSSYPMEISRARVSRQFGSRIAVVSILRQEKNSTSCHQSIQAFTIFAFIATIPSSAVSQIEKSYWSSRISH